jgi:tetratricopeptide (TPR) repeat protein
MSSSSTAPLLAHAVRLLKAGRPAEAIAPLADAVVLQPGNATIWHDLGLAYLETGRLAEAVDAFQRSVAINPRFTDAHFRMGIALEKLSEAGPAVVAYDRATELLPSHTEAWFRAGALVFTLGHRAEAAGCFRRAAATGPKTMFGRLGAARALLAEDRDEEASVLLRRLLALDPGNAMALDLLGNVLADAGRFDEARAFFVRAVAAAPLMAGSYYDLVRCRPITPDEAGLLTRMEAAAATPGLEDTQRMRVHLALGKAAGDLGDYTRAMRAFDAADALRNRIRPFDAADFDAQITRLIERFTPALMAQADSVGNTDATPVLIIGMPRSGTTLMEQVISSHPQVAAGGELNFWNERGGAWAASAGDGVEADFLARAASDYLGVLRGISPDALRVTDKMPFNFLWAGLIHLAFPRATIIHCRRAAIDTALSIHQTHFNPMVAFPTGGEALVAYFRSYARLMAHWRDVLPAARFFEVDYEALTDAPGLLIPRIIAATGLAWNEACLHPERNPRVVKTPSKWQARQPIYRDGVQRWRRYEPFLGRLRALLDEPAPAKPQPDE